MRVFNKFALLGLGIAIATMSLGAWRSGQEKDKAEFDAHEWGVYEFYEGVGVDIGALPASDELPEFVIRARDFRPTACGDNCGCARDGTGCPKDCTHKRGRSVEHCPDRCAGRRCGHMVQIITKPVINFYTDRDVTIRVRVRIESGQVKIWYPTHSSVVNRGDSVTWDGLKITNKEPKAALRDASRSRWWNTARDTGSAYVVNSKGEAEKFLLYEGDSTLLTAGIQIARAGKKVRLKSTTKRKYESVLVVRDGKIRLLPVFQGTADVDFDEDLIDRKKARSVLQKTIQDRGLSEKEAGGVVRIWEDSFFRADGIRVIFMMSRERADKILKVEMTPKPRHFRRAILVCVHDMETLVSDLIRKLASDEGRIREATTASLIRLGKPIQKKLEEALKKTRDLEVRMRLKQILKEFERPTSKSSGQSDRSFIRSGQCKSECSRVHFSHPEVDKHRKGALCGRCQKKTDVCYLLCRKCSSALNICFGCNRRVEGQVRDGSLCGCGKSIRKSAELDCDILVEKQGWTLNNAAKKDIQIVVRNNQEWNRMLKTLNLGSVKLDKPDFRTEMVVAIGTGSGIRARFRSVVEEEKRIRVVLGLTYPEILTNEYTILLLKFKKSKKPVEVC